MTVLIAGESWVTHSIHQKGFDSFTTTSYHEGVGPLRAALESGGVRRRLSAEPSRRRAVPDRSALAYAATERGPPE